LSELRGAGFEAYLVGGCVRDAVLGRAPHDWDVCTSAMPGESLRALCAHRVVPTGEAFGTITAVVGGVPVEVTTYRADGAYSDGRRPDSVRFSRTLGEDLSRRDFTVNALCADEKGSVVDLVGGLSDIKARVIRCVGDPDLRFAQDALRIWRALRFAAALDFDIEPATAASMRNNMEKLACLSPERVFSELCGLVCSDGCERLIRLYPDIVRTALVPFDEDWDETSVHIHLVPAQKAARLAALLRSVGPDNADRALRALRCDNNTREQAVALVRDAGLDVRAERVFLKRLIARLGEAGARALLRIALAAAQDSEQAAVIAQAESLLDEIVGQSPCLTLRCLAVGGEDVVACGGEKGPRVGAVLTQLLEDVIAEKLPNERETLLARVAVLKDNTPDA
jgi:tRNA nucleotidyltransferase (CCA-adding enzyme)